jgi:TPR repeat protein
MRSEGGRGSAAHRLELVADPAQGLQAALADGARAQWVDGDLLASRQNFERAYQLAERAADVRAMALAALGLAGLWVSERRTLTGAVQQEARLEHVLSLLDPHSSLALRIRTRLAGEADYLHGGHEAILAALQEARAAADPEVLAEALSMAHHCLLGPDHVRRRRELAVELIKTSFRTERRSDLLMGLLWQTVDSYSEGNPHAGRHLGELRDQLEQQNHLAVAFVVSAIDVMLAIRAGRLAEAESLAHGCAASGALAGDIDHGWWSGAQLVTIRWYQGRLGELLPALHEQVHSPDLSAVDNSAVAALAVAAALSGDLRTAASSLEALCGDDLAGLPRSSSWLVTMDGVVEAAYLLGHADVAEQAYDLLSPYASLPMVGGLGITCFGSAHHALGVASLTSGHLDRAVDHLRAAVQHNLALAHWPAVVASRQRLAQAYRLRGQPADTDAALSELDTAATEAAALGIPVPDGHPDPVEGSRPDPVPGSRRDPISGSRRDPVPGSRPDPVPGSRRDPVPGSRRDPVPGSRRDPVPGSRRDEPQGPFVECRRVGRKWRLTWQDRSALVEDSIGMAHLAVLVANPRQEIPAADLAAGLAALSAAGEGGSAHPVLDQAAIAEYRDRLRRLDAELDRLEPGDPQRGSVVQAERDWLVAQLASASGFGGRVRSFPDQGERARVAVGKAIRRALARITEADATLGDHLRQTVHTGVRCSYWPG